jgi:hypothetical protein
MPIGTELSFGKPECFLCGKGCIELHVSLLAIVVAAYARVEREVNACVYFAS